MSATGAPDPFGTAALRAAVLETWRRDPTRLRQDANVEEDHARGYYRDRVVVELAQNAADAAATAGEPGRLLLRLTGSAGTWTLLAANTGAPLTADGVASLSAMRASAKRAGGMVGRFGVGFAAVRSVSDEITVATRFGDGAAAAVRFSVAAATTAVRGLGVAALGDLLTERGEALPALRLPFPAAADVPEGWTTAVRLVLRGPREVTAVRRALDAVDDVALLALPALGEVRVETPDVARTVRDVDARWVTVRDAGVLDPALLADRPVEERERTGWSITWAVPRAGAGAVAGDAGARRHVVHAPTPTDDPLTLPALLIASFPLDPSRRHVAAGPLTAFLVAEAGRRYGTLAERLATADPDPLRLVPAGLPAGPLDGDLHAAALAALTGAALLRQVAGGELVTARTALALAPPAGEDPAVLAVLAALLPGLVRLPAGRLAEARRLGLEQRELAEAVEALPMSGPPELWHRLYDALAPYAATERDALAVLPVPLADGRFARGPRGLLLAPGGDLPPGLRVVHPDAAHPLLVSLGARSASATEILAELEPTGQDRLAEVLALAARAVAEEGEDVALPGWVGRLRLPAADGEVAPAAELVLPGSWAADVFDALGELDPGLARRHGPAVWRAVGVRTGLTVVRVRDVVADAEGAADDVALEGWADYLAYLADELGGGAYVADLTAVADLDAVAEEAWPRVLARVAGDPAARSALLEPVRAAGGGRDPAARALSYTAWWLREELGAPFAWPGAPAAAPFLPAPPSAVAGLDAPVLAALGAVRGLGAVDAAGWERYAQRWPAAGEVPLPAALALWRGLAAAVRAGTALPVVDAVPALHGVRAAMTPADDVVVGPPMWAQVAPVLPAGAEDVARVAEALDLDTAEDVDPDATGAVRVATPAQVRAVLPAAPPSWWECEQLRVAGVPVAWWAVGDEAWATTTAGAARSLAAAAGAWSRRLEVEMVLTEPDRLAEILAEAAGD